MVMGGRNMINEYRPILLGIQFILKEDENGITLNKVTLEDSQGNQVTDYEIYELYPEGRKYVGSFGLVGRFWENQFSRLVDNTRLSVIFYSESYTRTMMPDWIEGTMANTVIAYSRIYQMLKDDKNITSDQSFFIIQNTVVSPRQSTWRKCLDYMTGSEGEVTITPSTTLSKPTLCYPFVIKGYPEILAGLSNNGSIKFINKIEINYAQAQSYFPNVEIEKFNILLP